MTYDCMKTAAHSWKLGFTTAHSWQLWLTAAHSCQLRLTAAHSWQHGLTAAQSWQLGLTTAQSWQLLDSTVRPFKLQQCVIKGDFLVGIFKVLIMSPPSSPAMLVKTPNCKLRAASLAFGLCGPVYQSSEIIQMASSKVRRKPGNGQLSSTIDCPGWAAPLCGPYLGSLLIVTGSLW